jgi:hypothetical protein
MAAWSLSDKEWNALDRLRFGTGDATVFRNTTIILMSVVGRSKASIAHDLGCSIGTVDIIRKRYRQDGLDGMIPNKPPGGRRGRRPSIGLLCERPSTLHRGSLVTASAFGRWPA